MNGVLSIGGLSRGAGSLLFAVLLLTSHADCRPSTDEADDEVALVPDGDYGTVDNVEFHHVRIVDGVMHEDHPVVMYKEDFVNEDYDPNANRTSQPTDTHPNTNADKPKRHRHTQHQRHRRLKPSHELKQQSSESEKMFFDLLSDQPIANGKVDDDTAALNIEVSELGNPAKDEWLHKQHKKYRSRQRRNIYYRLPHSRVPWTAFDSYSPRSQQQSFQWHAVHSKEPVYEGPRRRPNGQNPTDVGVRVGDETNEIYDPDSLFHNSNPDDADFSKYDEFNRENAGAQSAVSGGAGAGASSNLQPTTTRPSWAGRPQFAVTDATDDRPRWEPSRNIPTSRPTFRPTPTPARQPPQPTSAPKVSNCVWAIVNCCTGSSEKVRYYCFENFGCHGAFWGVNPCANKIRNQVISHVAQIYNR